MKPVDERPAAEDDVDAVPVRRSVMPPRPGSIDRTTPHETSAPFLERVSSRTGLAREVCQLHQLIVDQRLLPAGSDVADRFSLLMGIVMGRLWKDDDECLEDHDAMDVPCPKRTP